MSEIGYFQWTQRRIAPPSVVVPHQPPDNGGSMAGLIIIGLIFLLIAIFLLRGPIKDVTHGYADSSAYRDLEREVTGILEITYEQSGILSDSLNEFAAQFEANLGIPLHLAHEKSTRQIDYAILKSESFTKVFVQILNSAILPESIEDELNTLNIVASHLRNDTLTEIDKSILQADLKWINSKQQEIQIQQMRLQQIVTWIQNESYPVDPIYLKGD